MTAPFKAECPHCFTTFNLKSRASAGKKVKCKNCGEPFVVKLIGARDPGDEFDEVIEDYEEEVEDYGDVPQSSMSLPPSRSSRPRPAKKKAKRKGKSSVPWKPIVIVLAVAAVGAGAWFGIGALSSGSLFTMFDTPEGLLDNYIDTQYDMIDTLAGVNSPDDMEWLKGKVDGYSNRIRDLNKRMVLLSPVSKDRAREVRKYSEELRKLHQEKLRDRSKAEIDRLRSANLINEEFQEAIRGLFGNRFTTEYITPTPDPRTDFPVEIYLAEQDRLSRDTAKVLIQVDDLSSAQAQMNAVKALTARYAALQEHEHLGAAMPGSPFFSRRITWSSFVGRLEFDAAEFARQAPEVKQVFDALSDAMHKLTMAEHESRFRRPGGRNPAGRPPGFDPSRPGVRPRGFPPPQSGQGNTSSGADPATTNKLRPLGLAMHNYHDAHKSFPGIDRDAQGHVGLSWRVHLLPFLEQGQLYSQFDLDADWKASQNIPLQNQRPDFFKSRYSARPSGSNMNVFIGLDAPFGATEPPRLRDIRDGSSNTIMIIESGRGTERTWTMPGGLPFSPSIPKQGLGPVEAGEYLAVMFDGSVRRIPVSINDRVFARMVQHSDGQPLQ